MKKTASTLLLLLVLINISFAQSDSVEMADGLYASGKIYVVVAVLVTILVGIFTYLILLDRKLSRLEKNKPGN